MKKSRRVYICSPLRPISITEPERTEELQNNIQLARDACTLAVYRGFIPVAPHIYFPQFLSDDNAAERKMGMDMGIELLNECSQLWLITPRISGGMSAEIKEARRRRIPVMLFTAAGFVRYNGSGDVTDNCYTDTLDGVMK